METFKILKESPPEPERYALCLLEDSPEKITKDHKIPFTEDVGDLGPYVYAIIEVEGEVFVLSRSKGSLEEGTMVYGTADSKPLRRALDMAVSWESGDKEPAPA